MEEIYITTNSKNDAKNLVKLSKEFEEEKCCYGITADNIDYFSKKSVICAKIDNEIVGYCYGTFENKFLDTSFYNKGDKSFYIEEIFVTKKYRDKNIGQKLFNFAEKYAKDNGCKVIELTAVSKNYTKLLSFYIEKLNMNLWSAKLVKILD